MHKIAQIIERHSIINKYFHLAGAKATITLNRKLCRFKMKKKIIYCNPVVLTN